MKKIIILLLFPCFIKAQDNAGISVGTSIGVQYSYKNIEVQFLENICSKEKYSFGMLNLQYHWKFLYAGYGIHGPVEGVYFQKGKWFLQSGFSGKYPLIAIGATTKKPEKIKISNNAICASLMATAGIADAFNQAISQHHYLRGSQFSDPELSWRNKYKSDNCTPRFPGSTSVFVAATDGYHLSRLVEHSAYIATVIVINNDGLNWKKRIIKGAILGLINRGMFSLFYNCVFK